MNSISPLAFIHPEARIGDNVIIEAFAYIDKDVEIDDDCHIRPHAAILAGTKLGKNVKIHEGSVIGATPQDFRWKGERSFCIIENDVVIREHVIINRSIHQGGETRIGHHTFVMAQSHIAHDTQIGKRCVIGNAVKIAGDCTIGNYSILSSNALVHERCALGRWVLIKGGCRVNGNVPPFTIMAHNPIEYSGANAVILRMGKFDEETVDEIAKCYRHVYQSHTSLFNAIKRIEIDVDPGRERDEILEFLRKYKNKIAALPTEMN